MNISLLFYLFLTVTNCDKVFKKNFDDEYFYDILNEDVNNLITRRPLLFNKIFKLKLDKERESMKKHIFGDGVINKVSKSFEKSFQQNGGNDKENNIIEQSKITHRSTPTPEGDRYSTKWRDIEVNEETAEIPEMIREETIPLLCSSSQKRKSLLLVSTLDGQLTAIDYNSGKILWSYAIGSYQSSLISSSLSKVDVTANGQWVRLIPSLDGSIYKFDGENITPLPINADILLQSSYKFNDDTVITGGKSAEVVGIDPATGEVVYSCGKEGCESSPTKAADSSLLVITKESKIVRAVDIKNGKERWNFSVGQRHLQVVQTNCAESDDDSDDKVNRLHFVVPDGLLNAESEWGILWTQKMPSPIVSAWKVTDKKANQLDLFSNVSVPAVSENKTAPSGSGASLYVGYHKDEFYVQESFSFKEKVTSYNKGLERNSYKDNLPMLKWRPYLATAISRTPVLPHDVNVHPLMIEYERKKSGEDMNPEDYKWTEKGLYLFDDGTEETPRRRLPFSFLFRNKSFDALCPIDILDLAFNELENKFYYMLIILGLMLVGCVSFGCTCCWYRHQAIKAVIMLMLSYFFNWIFRLLQSAGVDLNVPLTSNSNIDHQSEAGSDRSVEPSDRRTSDSTVQPFTSRLCNEFTAIECLGKGGFGYVFNAQHKVDATNYAIKRIKLPTRESSKVMREVYALAKLQHTHIVRYFSSWIETPPIGLESPFDALLRNEDVSFDPDNWEESETASSMVKPSLMMGSMNTISGNFSITNSHSISFGGGESSSPNDLSISFRNDDDSSSIIFEDSSKSTFAEISSVSAKLSPVDRAKLKSDRILASSDNIRAVLDSEGNSGRKRSRGKSESENQRTYLYIQMELCQQKTLREWLEENTIRDKLKILHTFNDIVHAVEYIHDQHLIHRDLKPSNIFFSNDGNVKVGDFGLVTTIDDEICQKMTEESILMAKRTIKAGTELYMSPEQKEKRQYNHKVDIFSLGIIFYEMLVPFGTEMERRLTLMKVRQRDFCDKFKADFPEEYIILNQMLNKNADLRPTTRGLRFLQPLADLQVDLHLIEEEERHVLRTNSQRRRLNSNKEYILL